jgi:hypothetical protein
MLTKTLHKTGLRGWNLHAASLASIGLCIGLWIRAKTVDQDERGNAERRALFVGLWPPMFWLIGDALERLGVSCAEFANDAPGGRWLRLRRSAQGEDDGRSPAVELDVASGCNHIAAGGLLDA